jgi:hypothetical protein
MKRVIRFPSLSGFLIFSPLMAREIDLDTVLDGAVGGAAGPAVGLVVGRREGAIIGGGLAGAAGTAIATSGKDSDPKPQASTTQVVPEHHYHFGNLHDDGLHRGHYEDKGNRKH